MKSLILDSSVFISSADPRDVFHHSTRNFIIGLEEKMQDIEIIVPILIVLEVSNILKKSVQESMWIFEGGRIIEFTVDLVDKIIPIFRSVRLKTSDAAIVACAKIFDADLISWDKKLVKEAKHLVKAYMPEDYSIK